MKLTREQRRGIRNWLNETDKSIVCPFVGLDGRECYLVCPVMFPSLKWKRTTVFRSCPCSFFALSYVVKVARVALARHGVVGERRTKA